MLSRLLCSTDSTREIYHEAHVDRSSSWRQKKLIQTELPEIDDCVHAVLKITYTCLMMVSLTCTNMSLEYWGVTLRVNDTMFAN